MSDEQEGRERMSEQQQGGEMDLSVDLCGVRLPNPTVLASGILGLTPELLARVARAGAGAVTTKSTSLSPRAGHPNPSVLDWGPGLINAVGLSNPGIEAMIDEIVEAKALLAGLGAPVIASIFAETVADYGTMARAVSEAEPDLIEVNISCPNVNDQYTRQFAADPRAAAEVTEEVKRNTGRPVLVKLSPNVSDIVEIARSVVNAGADGITAINSLGPGLILDVETGQPVLSHGTGGISGPAVRPIAVRCVRDICQAVNVPVVAVGGVASGRDVAEMLLVGATAVGIGSAVHYKGLGVFAEATRDLQAYMQRHGYRQLSDFRGRSAVVLPRAEALLAGSPFRPEERANADLLKAISLYESVQRGEKGSG